SPYTYAYEEPPVGSLVLGIWTQLIGGLTAFGFSLNSGRVLMFLLHLASTALVYGITLRATKRNLPAIIATLVFAFSPLVVALQRRVLLDNIMLVWLLLALFIILGENRTLKHYFMSAVCFGIAVQTKGAALGFLPAFVYIVTNHSSRIHRRFATGHWVALSLFIVSLYPLYAQMKEELFPQGWFLGGDFPHVSLLERLADRGPDTGRFLNIGAGFTESFQEWVNLGNATADPIIIYGGIVCAIFALLMAVDNRPLRPIVAMVLAFIFKLAISGPIFPSDIILGLPFLAACIGIVIGAVANAVGAVAGGSPVRYALATVVAAAMLYPFGIFYSQRTAPYTANQVEGQIEAVRWISENLPEDAVIVTDNYAFVELRRNFQNAHHYWKVDTDPAVKYAELGDDVCNIDYVLSTPQVVADVATYQLDLMRRAIEQSELLITYPNNGWPVEIRRTNKANCLASIVDSGADGANAG
ncbi:MAG: glycosyltransferase family 39 protein, partial [Chloroflexota bacterium]